MTLYTLEPDQSSANLRHPNFYSQLCAHIYLKYVGMCMYVSHCSNSKMTIWGEENLNVETHNGEVWRDLLPFQRFANIQAAVWKNILRPLNSSSSLKNLFLSYILARAEERRFLKPSYIYTAKYKNRTRSPRLSSGFARSYFDRRISCQTLFAVLSFKY